MPGRTSARSTRSARSSGAAAPRKTTGRGRSSATNIEIPDEGPELTLRTEIAQIFSDAQSTTATQRKLQTMLRKIQERCCLEQPQSKKKKAQLEEEFDEEQFNGEVMRCLLRVLSVKKGVQEADRIIRFLGLFLKHALDKDRQLLQLDGEDTTETPTSRLIAHIIRTLLSILFPRDGNPVHNKIVHFRATQSLTHIIAQLDSLDDELFALLRLSFKKLSRHKEASVRVQAVLGLSHLVNTDEDEDEDEDEEDLATNITDKLLEMMQHDPSAEVRRAILHNIELDNDTKRYIFERAKDVDPMVRRIVYRKILPTLNDFRHMRLHERETLLRWGLLDRDDFVRKAAARVFCECWIEDCAASHDTRPEEEKKPGEPVPPSLQAVEELLERIDVVGNGGEDGIAHKAMQHFWELRPDYRDFLTFSKNDEPTKAFWLTLNPYQAFIVRSLKDYANNLNDNNLAESKLKDELESKFPDVRSFAFIIKTHLDKTMNEVQKYGSMELPEDDDDVKKQEEILEDQTFVTNQLIHVALSLDYSPPMERQLMHGTMREALSRAELPEDCTKLAIQVLRVCSDAEPDFCRIILEAIAEVRDTLMPDDDTVKGEDVDDEDSFHSAQSDIDSDAGETRPKKVKAPKELDPEEEERRHNLEVGVYLKCLHIAQVTLENVVESNLQSDTSLVTILNTLIVPAVRGQEAMLRERGITCLALCCILSKDLAENNMDLFFHCFAKGHDALKEIIIQALVDIVYTHKSLLEDDMTEDGELTPSKHAKRLTKAIIKGFRSENDHISLISCTAASKLLLFDLLPATDAVDVLKEFTLAYFNPETASHPGIQQALSYFLSTFCHSQLKNALLMAEVGVPIVSKLLQMQEDMDDEDENEMVGWPVITAHIADWTDGRKVVNQTKTGIDGKVSIAPEAEEPHINLAIGILEHTLGRGCSKDERKAMLMLLTKVYIAPSGPAPDEEALSTLQRLVTEAVESKLGMDATQRNYLTKLENNLAKRMGDVETVTQAADSDEEAAAPEATENPAVDSGEEAVTPKAAESPEPAPTEDEVEEEEDTMMAGIQGESTRMPLDFEDDDNANRIMTESDIVESLLASEMDVDDVDDDDDDEDTTVVPPTRASRS